MTPILDYVLRNASGLAKAWNPNLSGIPSLRSFLTAIADSVLYLIPEAETDTTAAAEAHPTHFATNEHVTMPWHSIWIEYRAYAPPFDTFVGDSAFFLTLEPAEGKLLCYGVTLMAGSPQAFAMPVMFFGWPISDLGRADAGPGKEYRLHPAEFVPAEGAAKACDFVRELLAYINGAPGVSDTVRKPSSADQRRLQGVLGARAAFPPLHVLRTDGDVVSRTTVAPRAARAMGPAYSGARH